jgi:hypothetical protein
MYSILYGSGSGPTDLHTSLTQLTQIMATSLTSLSVFRLSVRQVEKFSVRYISEQEMGREGPIQRGQIPYTVKKGSRVSPSPAGM